MKIKTDRLRLMATLFSGSYESLDILCGEEGMDVYARSLDMVSVMSVRIPAQSFADYVPLPRFGLDVKDCLAAVKHMGEDTSMALNDSRLELSSEGFKAVLPLPVTPEDKRTMPRLELGCGFMCDPAPLKKVIDASKIAMIRMDLDPERLYVSALDERGCGPSVEVPATAMLSSEGTGKATYSSSHFGAFLSKFPKGSVASFEFDTNMPLSVSFVIDDMEGTYMLAPMVEDYR